MDCIGTSNVQEVNPGEIEKNCDEDLIESSVRVAKADSYPGLLRLVIGLIALHSCLLGLAMLFFPRPMMQLLGFDQTIPIFFPSQSGIFLFLLGGCYFIALRNRAFIKVIIVSKAAAVVFLAVHSIFLSAPPIVWGAGAGDAGMLIAILVLLHWYRLLK